MRLSVISLKYTCKVLQFAEFHSEVGKTFTGLVSSLLKERKQAIDSLGKLSCFVVKSAKLFSRLTFVIYSITCLHTLWAGHFYYSHGHIHNARSKLT